MCPNSSEHQTDCKSYYTYNLKYRKWRKKVVFNNWQKIYSEGRNILNYFKSVRQWIPSYLQSSLNQRYCTKKQSAVNVIFQSHYKNLFWKQIHQKNILTAAQNLPKSFSGMASGLTEIKFKWQISYQYYFSAFFLRPKETSCLDTRQLSAKMTKPAHLWMF